MGSVWIDLLRSFVTNLMVALLIFSLAQPKMRRGTIIVAVLLSCALYTALNGICYVRGMYLYVVYADIFILVPALVLAKPFFKDTFFQWCFNIVTALNVLGVVRFLDGEVLGILPYPEYTMIVSRAVLLGIVSLLFTRKLRPFYVLVRENCGPYLPSSLGILAAFVFLMANARFLTSYRMLYAMVSVLAVLFYISAFWSLREISGKYVIREENLRMKSREMFLSSSARAMQHSLSLMEELSKQSRIKEHDARHKDAVLLQLMQEGKAEEAVSILKRQLAFVPSRSLKYCENTTMNSIVSYYVTQAEASQITCRVSIDIPETIGIDSFGLAMAVSNLLENAIHACLDIGPEWRWISFNAACNGQLLLSIENSCKAEVRLGLDGLPLSDGHGHGTGTQSVLAFIEEHDGEIVFSVRDGRFLVRMLL